MILLLLWTGCSVVTVGFWNIDKLIVVRNGIRR